MMGNLYKNQNLKFSMWAKRLVFDLSEAVQAVVSNFEATDISDPEKLDVDAAKTGALQNLDAVQNLDKNSAEYSEAKGKIEAAANRLKNIKLYLVARNTAEVENKLDIKNMAVTDRASYESALQTRNLFDKLAAMRQLAGFMDDNNYDALKAGQALEISMYFSTLVDSCNAHYRDISAVLTPTEGEEVSEEQKSSLADKMATYKIAIEDFRFVKGKNFSGAPDFVLMGEEGDTEHYYNAAFNYYSAWQAVEAAKLVGDQSKLAETQDWFRGAEQKQRFFARRADFWDLGDRISGQLGKIYKTEDKYPADINGLRGEMRQAWELAATLGEKSDWVNGLKNVQLAITKAEEVWGKIKDMTGPENDEVDEKARDAAVAAQKASEDFFEAHKDKPYKDDLVEKGKSHLALALDALTKNDYVNMEKEYKATLAAQQEVVREYNDIGRAINKEMKRGIDQFIGYDKANASLLRKLVTDYVSNMAAYTPLQQKYLHMFMAQDTVNNPFSSGHVVAVSFDTNRRPFVEVRLPTAQENKDGVIVSPREVPKRDLHKEIELIIAANSQDKQKMQEEAQKLVESLSPTEREALKSAPTVTANKFQITYQSMPSPGRLTVSKIA